MAAVVLGGGRDTEEAAAVGRSANYARAGETSRRRARRVQRERVCEDARAWNREYEYKNLLYVLWVWDVHELFETVALSQHPLHRSIITSVGHALSPRQC